MFFASDNTGPVHPRVMEALAEANANHAMPYGDDEWTARAIGLIRDVFEAPEAVVQLVPSGTAANALSLATLARPWDAVFCAPFAHVYADECNAPEFFSGGARMVPVGDREDRFTAEALAVAMDRFDPANIQSPAPGPVTITQLTERGTLYPLGEIRAIADVVHDRGQALHMDGARFANALASLGCTPAEMSWRAGVDALSFGGTKNGLMGVEAVVFFDPARARDLDRRRKRAAQRLSKARFLGAQMVAYLEDGLWLELAAAANAAAASLASALAVHPDAKLDFEPAANMIYVWLPRRLHRRLADEGAVYYIEKGRLDGGDPNEPLLARLVCDWSTPGSATDRYAALLNG